jgi:hypothetical protein
MQWQEYTNIMVRHLINDMDFNNYKYSDDRINSTVAVAAQLVVLELDFNASYSVDVASQVITPDPTSDNAFTNLVVMRASVIIVGGEVKTEASNAISIKDGPSAIDLRGVSSTLLALYKDLSDKYDSLAQSYGYTGSVGKAILGPYSPGSDYVTRTNNDYNFRGNYFRY